jgi:hypothetical protein
MYTFPLLKLVFWLPTRPVELILYRTRKWIILYLKHFIERIYLLKNIIWFSKNKKHCPKALVKFDLVLLVDLKLAITPFCGKLFKCKALNNHGSWQRSVIFWFWMRIHCTPNFYLSSWLYVMVLERQCLLGYE